METRNLETAAAQPGTAPAGRDGVEIRFCGHASIYIRTPKVSLVTDPWFSRSGAFLSSWFQYPDNTDLDLEAIRNVDYVFLSHEHQDHFDPAFLQTISPKAKIVIPKYTDSYLRDELTSHVRNEVIVATTMTKLRLGEDLVFTPIVQSVPIWDDCTLIFETPAGVIVDVNDMKITPSDMDWVKSNFPIDYLFIQFSGANWHPFVYDYSPEKKADIAAHKIATKFHNVKQIFLNSGAKYLIPFAGPPCFLDDAQFAMNFSAESIFPSQDKFHAYAVEEGFADRTILLLPGDRIDPGADLAERNARVCAHPAYSDKRGYLAAYRGRRRDLIARRLAEIEAPQASLLSKCRDYFAPLISGSPFFRKKIGARVLLDIAGPFPEKIVVDFTDPVDPVRLHQDEEIYYTFSIESRFLNLILERKLNWEELFLSLRFRASRQPDIYNEFLTVFLRFANQASFLAYERYETRKVTGETFILKHSGKTFEVQRYCPHAMGDLSKGKVKNGCIVCPNHGWAFSLKDGTCAQNHSTIKTRELAPT